MRFVGLIGNTYGYLTVVEKATMMRNSHTMYVCTCRCGSKKNVIGSLLANGSVTSCGCRRVELGKNRRTHGMTGTRIHRIWMGMNNRCTPTESYKKYVVKGIKVCERWRSFVHFYEDMKNGYSDDLTLERINPYGDYEPSNCRWATWQEQAENKTTSQFLTIDGETKRLAEWAKITGYSQVRIRQRIVRNGYSPKEAVFNPPKSSCKLVIHLPSGVYYESITEAAKFSPFSHSQIRKMLNNIQPNISGFAKV